MNMLLVFNVTFDICLAGLIVTIEHIAGGGVPKIVVTNLHVEPLSPTSCVTISKPLILLIWYTHFTNRKQLFSMEAQHKREMCLIGN